MCFGVVVVVCVRAWVLCMRDVVVYELLAASNNVLLCLIVGLIVLCISYFTCLKLSYMTCFVINFAKCMCVQPRHMHVYIHLRTTLHIHKQIIVTTAGSCTST